MLPTALLRPRPLQQHLGDRVSVGRLNRAVPRTPAAARWPRPTVLPGRAPAAALPLRDRPTAGGGDWPFADRTRSRRLAAGDVSFIATRGESPTRHCGAESVAGRSSGVHRRPTAIGSYRRVAVAGAAWLSTAGHRRSSLCARYCGSASACEVDRWTPSFAAAAVASVGLPCLTQSSQPSCRAADSESRSAF